MGPSDPPRRSVALSTGPASYTDEGRSSGGPAILAVHGLPGSARDFRWLAPHLSPFARVVRLEMPGFGETPLATQPDRSALGRGRYVCELARALDLERPVLLGHSMGGVVSCAAIHLEPGSFRGLALLSSPGLRPQAMLRATPFGLVSGLLKTPVVGSAMAPMVRRSFRSLGFRGYPEHELIGALHCVAKTSIPEHAERVRRLETPTLVAYCDDDPLIEADIARELAEICPEGPRLAFPEGGHNPQKTHAAEIAASLLDWARAL